MDIRDLRYVIALNDCGTLTRAAERLHVSRQAVAKTVRNLEAEAGARLFERIDAGHVPTERGEELVSGGRRVVAAFDQLCERTLRHPGGAPDARGELREPLNIALVTGGRKAVPKGLFERYAACGAWACGSTSRPTTPWRASRISSFPTSTTCRL